MTIPQGFTRGWLALVLLLLSILVLPAQSAVSPSARGDAAGDEAIGRPDYVEVRVVGRVRELSPDERAFTVEVGEMSFRVEPGFGTRFPALRAGDRVRVVGTLRTQTRVSAREVQVLGGPTARNLTGTLRQIDLRSSRMTIRAESGEMLEVEFDDETVLARLGRRVTVEQLRAGDALWVEGRQEGRGLLRATRIEVTASGPSDPWQEGRSGEIVGVNRRTRTLRVDFGGETRSVTLDAGARIQRGTRSLLFEDLGAGDRIRVRGALRGNAVEAGSIEVIEDESAERTVEGRVRSIDRASRVLRVTLDTLIPISVSVYVPPDASITRGPRPLTLDDLREGDQVRARGPSRGGRVSADTVEVLP